MEKLAPTINRLRELTTELAKEIKHGDGDGEVLNFLEIIFDHIEGTYIEVVTYEYKLLYVNPWGKEQLKDLLDLEIVEDKEYCYKKMWNRDTPCPWCPVEKAIDERRIIHLRQLAIDNPISTNYEYCITVIPLLYNGVSGAILIVSNIEFKDV